MQIRLGDHDKEPHQLLDYVTTTASGSPTAAQCAANLAVKNWASLGDSYSNIVGDGLQDYEALMATDVCLQGKKPQYLSNPDATISQVASQQVPKLNGNTNFVTISAGANDIGLVQILDACVYNFIGSASLDCSRTLDAAANTMSSSAFAASWSNLLTQVRSVLAKNGGKAYVVGNAAFFDETTPSCTQTSLSVYAGAGQQKYLTDASRKNLNELIHRFNWWQHYLVTKYNRAQVPSGNILQYPIQFIDPDDRFNTRRFCKRGAVGTGSGDPNTWFSSGENLKTPMTRSPYEKMKPPTICAANGGWNEYIHCQMAKAIQRTSFLTLTKSGSGTSLNNWERVFHPTTNGEDAIRDEIVSQIAQGPALSGHNLRILPLGASITAGAHSTDGNGFRKTIYDTLRKTNTVSYVGSQGTAPLLHEGHPGWIINDVSSVASVSLPSRPNVVLIHVGTNDLLTNTNIDQAPERLGALVDHVLSVAKDAVVLVAQLLPSDRPGAFDKFVTFNARVASILNQKQVQGKKVMKVWMPITTEDLVDGIHPADAGYNKMAQAWIKGLQRAADKGWIAIDNRVVQQAFMASKSTTMAHSIGSMPWLGQENQQIAQFSAQETEDFAFSVRNELDFLNEHMAEIFSKNQLNITEVFKTPGKLRGKTPRTARKRNPLEIREPLNDIFAPNAKITASPSRGPNDPKEQRRFEVAKDPAPQGEKKIKTNNDSGYHGMTEDEIDIDEQIRPHAPRPGGNAVPLLLEEPQIRHSGEQSATDGSFITAKEETTREVGREPSNAYISAKEASPEPTAQAPQPTKGSSSLQPQQANAVDNMTMESEVADKGSVLDDVENDSLRSPSEGSSPAIKGLVRKSSLTFAALPAREPLTTKKSIGARHSQVERGVMSRSSFLGRITGGKSLGGSRQPEIAPETHGDDQMDIDDSEKPSACRQESESDTKAARLHNKSSTQRLHDRINMLGKSQPARPTKSIPAAAALSQVSYPEIRQKPATRENVRQSSKADDDEEDWIKPPSVLAKDSPRPQLSKSISADVMENLRGKANISDEDFGTTSYENIASPRRHSLPRESEGGSPNNPSLMHSQSAGNQAKSGPAEQVNRSTTPHGTPVSNRYADGPISASKSKMQSIMKTARGLFTSSAGASAQAKMELRKQAQLESPDIPSPSRPVVKGDDTGLYPSLPTTQKMHAPPLPVRPQNPAKPAEVRRTRGSIEKERKEKERQEAEMELGKPRSEEARKAVASPQEQVHDVQATASESQPETATVGSGQPPNSREQHTRKSPRRLRNPQDAAPAPEATERVTQDVVSTKTAQPPPSSNQLQLQKPRDLKRPVKPAKETAPKPEPQRVAIRVGTLSQRIPLTNAALSSGLQDSLPPPANKRPGLTKKTSIASIQTAASNSSLRNTTTSKPKALLAAERKKEQDEREAQRKLEQKREIERKRAAQQEEARRQEQVQRQEAERQREQDRAAAAEDPKKLAQRQAIEKRRQELARKEQQRAGSVVQQQMPSTSRPELGGARPPSKMHTVQESNRPPLNHPVPDPAKAPIKRVFEPEVEEPVRQSRLPGGKPYQANEAKRRRTDDEAADEPQIRPTMAPPKRQSNLHRDVQRPYGPSLMGPPSSMTNGYSHAKPPTTNHTYQPQYQHQTQPARSGQPPDMTKYANGRIVFAENTNSAYPPHKTPNQSRLTNQAVAKSSPQYTNGENIQLEDIPTDSDEEDSESENNKKAKGAMLPSWVQSPILNEMLREQERSKDPDSIFGPSAKVDMEEMFKERHHRFRARTSSANWGGNDRLTEEEIRSDNAARERMRREGGWTFGL
ncbi:MAG: hypothetical protein Q9181_001496 [Wetmoreana brouardii]